MSPKWPTVKFAEFLYPNSRPHMLGPVEDANLVGFAVFEGPGRLLDWGVRSCSHSTRDLYEVVAKRVQPLLFRYEPVAVVLRSENHYASHKSERHRISIGSIRKESNRCGVEFRLLKTVARKRFFVRFRCKTKYQVAELIAQLFEELSGKAQPKRRAWHSESYHTVIFDAVATGLAAFADRFNSETVQEVIATAESFRRLP